VRRWRARFADAGPGGVEVIAKGRGRKQSLPPGTVSDGSKRTQPPPSRPGPCIQLSRLTSRTIPRRPDRAATVQPTDGIRRFESRQVNDDSGQAGALLFKKGAVP